MEKQKQRRINWHHAACEVLKIELEEYEEYLNFYEEYHLGTSKDSLRIDVLIIQKKQYKVMGYGNIFRSNTGKVNEVSNDNITLTFITSKFPRKLKKELEKRNIPLVKRALGIYDIYKDIFQAQIIINRKLDEEENLWLRCLDNQLKEKELYERLEREYRKHKNERRYSEPMNAIIWSNFKQKGERKLMCEAGKLEFCFSSSFLYYRKHFA